MQCISLYNIHIYFKILNTECAKFHKEKKTSCLRSRLSKLMSTQVQTLKCNELQCFVCLGNNYLGKAATEVNIETRRNSTTIVVLF